MAGVRQQIYLSANLSAMTVTLARWQHGLSTSRDTDVSRFRARVHAGLLDMATLGHRLGGIEAGRSGGRGERGGRKEHWFALAVGRRATTEAS